MINQRNNSGFTKFQDLLLIEAAKYFNNSWILVQNRVAGKSAKECELRYKELLDSGQLQQLNDTTDNAAKNTISLQKTGFKSTEIRKKVINKSPSKMNWTATPTLKPLEIRNQSKPVNRSNTVSYHHKLLPKSQMLNANPSPKPIHAKQAAKKNKKAVTSPVKLNTISRSIGMSSPFTKCI